MKQSYELRSAKYSDSTHSTRIVYALAGSDASEAMEDVIYHDQDADEIECANQIDAFIAAL